MKESTQKEKVLKNVRDALLNPMQFPFDDVDLDTPLFHAANEDSPDVHFAEEFSNANGKFIYCADASELLDSLLGLLRERGIRNLFCSEDYFDGLLEEHGIECFYSSEDLGKCDASLTGCEVLISRLGTIVLSSRQGGGRKGYISAPIQIVIAGSRQLVPDINGAIRFLYKKYGPVWPSLITFLTGPGQNENIGNMVLQGVDEPKDLYLLLLNTGSE